MLFIPGVRKDQPKKSWVHGTPKYTKDVDDLITNGKILCIIFSRKLNILYPLPSL